MILFRLIIELLYYLSINVLGLISALNGDMPVFIACLILLEVMKIREVIINKDN